MDNGNPCKLAAMKFRLNKPHPKGWKTTTKPKRERVQFKTGFARTAPGERELVAEMVPPPVRRGEYLYANCVVLAAAVFGPSSQAWAENLLPAARLLDWRRTQ